jgi:hypothetical protein
MAFCTLCCARWWYSPNGWLPVRLPICGLFIIALTRHHGRLPECRRMGDVSEESFCMTLPNPNPGVGGLLRSVRSELLAEVSCILRLGDFFWVF